MSVNLGPLTRKITRVHKLFVALLVVTSMFATLTRAGAQKITPPTTPSAITPPAGNSAFLLGHAVGTQGYVCLPTSAGASTASWTVNASRPEATLFVNVFGRYVEVVTHFLSPDTNPNQSAPNPLPSGAQRGRVPSIPARCGDKRCNRFPLALTRVARMLARLPASYCGQLGRKRDRLAVTS
jgi:Protein of unknown function (DUF3455)